MFEITAEYIERELKKIAFFVQYSGLFEDFPTRTRDALDALPVEWETVKTEGQITLEDSTDLTWEKAYIDGNMGEKPFNLIIERENKRNSYTVKYNKNKFTVSSLRKLKSLVENLSKGKPPKEVKLEKIFDILQNDKKDISKYSTKYYLDQVTNKPWNLRNKKDINAIYIRFYIPISNEAEKNTIREGLKFDNSMRINAIGSFIKNKVLPKNGIDTSDLTFTQRLIDMPNEVGFLISIK
jgi:hypothetical protein